MEHPRFALQRKTTDLCEYLREYLAAKYDEISLAGFALQVDIPETPCLCPIDGFELGRAWTTSSATPCATTGWAPWCRCP